MLFSIMITATIIFGYTVGIISYKIRNNSVNQSMRQLGFEATRISYVTQMYFDNFTRTAFSSGEIFAIAETMPNEAREISFSTFVEKTIEQNPWFLSFSGFIYPENILKQQLFFKKFQRQNNQILAQNYPEESWNTIFEDYSNPYIAFSEEKIEYRSPVESQGEIIGGIVIESVRNDLYQFIRQLGKSTEGTLAIFTTSKSILCYSDTAYPFVPLHWICEQNITINTIQKTVSEGVIQKIIIDDNRTNEKYIVHSIPISISKASQKLAMVQIVPYNLIASKASYSFWKTIITGVIGLLLLTILVWLVARFITAPMNNINRVLQNMAIGDVSFENKLQQSTNDEIGQMMSSINHLIDGINRIVDFASEIGKGNLDVHYKPLSKNDRLGISLEQMRQRLLQLKEEEEQQQEIDQQQAWVTSGIAQFGEILRVTSSELQNLCNTLVQNICSYMQKPQCTIFISDDNPQKTHYIQWATYAYGNFKLLTKEIELGEELVGHIIQTKRTLLLENIPQTFPILKPELSGDEIPTNFLLTPLIVGSDMVIGALEIVSYQPFKAHEIEFVEKLAGNVASTINSVKINVRTAELLKQSQDQKEILAQHEEEMRQNMEEMLATQEETLKRETELKSIIKAFQDYCLIAHLTPDAKIQYINRNFATLFGMTPAQMEGKFYEAFAAFDSSERSNFSHIWDQLTQGNMQKMIHKLDLRNRTVFLSETFIPIMDHGMEEIKTIILVAQEVTHKVQLDRQIAALVAQIEKFTKA